MDPVVLIILVLVGVIVVIAILQGGRAKQPPFGEAPSEANNAPRRQRRFAPPPAPVARRKFGPPPLPMVPVTEVVEVTPAELAKPAAPATSAKLPKVDASQTAPTRGNLLDLLKNPKTLKSVIVLREVLNPPLCKRRR